MCTCYCCTVIDVTHISVLLCRLAHGCVSVRYIYDKMLAFKRGHPNAKSGFDSFLSELLWRDFFTYTANAVGAKMFYSYSLAGTRRIFASRAMQDAMNQGPHKWSTEMVHFNAWINGTTGNQHSRCVYCNCCLYMCLPANTVALFLCVLLRHCVGYPLIDAAMTELKLTGFLSNRLRQVVASFLTKDLNVDWRYGEHDLSLCLHDCCCFLLLTVLAVLSLSFMCVTGAEYFESVLVDHDVCVNWLNWAWAR